LVLCGKCPTLVQDNCRKFLKNEDVSAHRGQGIRPGGGILRNVTRAICAASPAGLQSFYECQAAVLLDRNYFAAVISPGLLADQVEMQNGDRLSGKVLSVSADTVVLKSDVLGKINVPRKNIAVLAFGTNVVAAGVPANNPRVPAPAMSSAAASMAWLETNADFAAALHNPGADTNVIRQVRAQMLADNPVAAAKFDERETEHGRPSPRSQSVSRPVVGA
jgi:hypothetical protein